MPSAADVHLNSTKTLEDRQTPSRLNRLIASLDQISDLQQDTEVIRTKREAVLLPSKNDCTILRPLDRQIFVHITLLPISAAKMEGMENDEVDEQIQFPAAEIERTDVYHAEFDANGEQ